jgi:uncharacterized membrane protein YcaP (DUF421 family)
LEWSLIWKSLLLITSGIILLRFSGRKSISQMTTAQTVVMISIGTIIIQPIINNRIDRTIVAAAVFVGFLILLEYLQLKFNFVEKLITGSAKEVIHEGVLQTDNLRKMRFTVDQLEMRLRQQGITDIKNVKSATLEPNGQIGYELMRHAQPLTIGEIEKMLGHLIQKQNQPQVQPPNLFDEVSQNKHQNQPPDQLQ